MVVNLPVAGLLLFYFFKFFEEVADLLLGWEWEEEMVRQHGNTTIKGGGCP